MRESPGTEPCCFRKAVGLQKNKFFECLGSEASIKLKSHAQLLFRSKKSSVSSPSFVETTLELESRERFFAPEDAMSKIMPFGTRAYQHKRLEGFGVEKPHPRKGILCRAPQGKMAVCGMGVFDSEPPFLDFGYFRTCKGSREPSGNRIARSSHTPDSKDKR